MTITLFVSLGLTLILLLLSFLFRIAGKLRLTLPLFYFLLTATILNSWAATHETLALTILFLLIAVSVISWVISLRNAFQNRQKAKAIEEDYQWQIARAKSLSIPLDSVYFDASGNMRYAETDALVF